MFNTIKIIDLKKYFAISSLLLFCIVISSCDGRNKAFRTTQEDLATKNVLDSFTNTITYIPENYSEKITDTLLANGLIIKIKHYTSLNNAILISNKQTKNYYREFVAEIEVFDNQNVLFKNTINKSFILMHTKLLENPVLDNLLLKNIEVNQELSLLKDQVSLTLSYCKGPETTCIYYLLTIKKNGRSFIKQIPNLNAIDNC